MSGECLPPAVTAIGYNTLLPYCYDIPHITCLHCNKNSRFWFISLLPPLRPSVDCTTDCVELSLS